MKLTNLVQYEVLQSKVIKDINATGHLIEHKKTGAKIVCMESDDENKVFSIAFRTPPEDSTGLPHILEHSVLCGSKNFPVKDPFVELAKGSLNTFLNAMTYPDKTIYPVASCNDIDFQNLMHVYMDAVFYPNIYNHKEIFQQEGWSYSIEEADAPLEYNGVVYNEMKGAFSSPDGVLDRMILNSLFPDTSYANESGGDPEVIPELTYEQFINFHKTYYHPSNSYIYLYGDMDMEEKLSWLDKEYLGHFDKICVNSELKKQAPFSEMKEVEIPYSIASNEKEEDNTYLSWNKAVGESLDIETVLAFQVLDYALLSAPGAPLKKALTDAKIGKDILGSYDSGILQPIFSIVSKNANIEQKEEFIKIIVDTLKSLTKDGINQKSIEAGINYNEFHFREADYGRYPSGLMYGLNMFDSWLYDSNEPFMYLEILDIYKSLKEKNGTGYYEELIQTYLLDNTHGSIVVVKPEIGRTAKVEEQVRKELETYKNSLSEDEITQLIEDTKKLEIYQDEPSSEEDAQKIPILKREDISKDILPICNEELEVEDIKVIYHEIETNGIGYLDFVFDVKNIPTELVPYLGLIHSALGMMDTKTYEYGELFNEINVHTGGIMSSLEIYPNVRMVQQREYIAALELKTKALYNKLPVSIELMKEMIQTTKYEDGKRLREILDILVSRLESKFLSSGHTVSVLRGMSYNSTIAKFKDMTSGVAYYDFVKSLVSDFDNCREEISANLQKVAKIAFRKENLIINYTASKEGVEKLPIIVKDLLSAMYTEDIKTEPYVLETVKKNEGLKTASKVQYVARTGNFIDKGVPYTGALQILKTILSYDYLWQNVRVKGGAYGCMSGFNRIGEGFLTSYRDPNLKETMDIYEGVVEYLENFSADEREMTKYIIGTMSSVDQPLTPAGKGDRSFNLYMNQVSEEMLKKERAEILTATTEDINRLKVVLEAVLEHKNICVIGSEEKIEQNKEMFKEIRDLIG